MRVKGITSKRNGHGIVGGAGRFRHGDRSAQAGDHDSGFIVGIEGGRLGGWIEQFNFENIVTRRHLLKNNHAIWTDRAGKSPLPP